MMDRIWWTKVTNAVRFITNISESIDSGCSVILQLPEYVPWYDTMMERISTIVTRDNSTRVFKKLPDEGTEPGEYLLRTFCKQEVRAQYRPGIGYPKFLAQIEDIPLNQSILWISGADAAQAKRWHGFIMEYNKMLGKHRKGGLFVVEAKDVSSFKGAKGIKIISYDESIEVYDSYVFNMLAAAELKETKLFKQYLSEVVTSLFPEDVELGSLCISQGKDFLNHPLVGIRRTVAENRRSDGAEFTLTASEKQLRERLWKAQIKIIFPLIEQHRNEIISRYRDQIEPLLPLKAAYGEEIDEVSDVELGTINYLVTIGKINVSPDDRHKIGFLKKMRNTLAHIGVIEQKDVDTLFML